MVDYMNFIFDVTANGLWVLIYVVVAFVVKKKRKSARQLGSRTKTISRSSTIIEDLLSNAPQNPSYIRSGRPLPKTPMDPFPLASLGHFYEDVVDAPRKRHKTEAAAKVKGRHVHRRLTFPLMEASDDSLQVYQEVDPLTNKIFTPVPPPRPISTILLGTESQNETGTSLLPPPPPSPLPPPPPFHVSLEEGRYGYMCPRLENGRPRPVSLAASPPPPASSPPHPPLHALMEQTKMEEGRLYGTVHQTRFGCTVIDICDV